VSLVTIAGQLQRIIDELVSKGVPLEAAKREFEKKYVSAAVTLSSGNMGQAARTLGIHRNTLRTKISLLRVKPVRSRRDDT
jgi:DNA-binding NtrC family response regulator